MMLDRIIAVKEYFPNNLATRSTGTRQLTVYTGEAARQYRSGLESFISEAKKLAELTNVPEIVNIYDCIMENNTGYIIMELLKGSSVKEILDQKKSFSYEEASDIIQHVLTGLTAIHAKGLIHRDISPDNIIITDEGKIKLIDFGAARHTVSGYSVNLAITLKPGYAPAEQYRSKSPQGTWMDIYAVCATFYRMITGIVPQESMDRLLEDQLQTPSELGVRMPESAERALMKGLAVRREDRIQTAEELKQQLFPDSAASGAVSGKPEDREKNAEDHSGRKKVVAGGVLIVIVAASVFIGIFIGQQNSQKKEADSATMQVQKQTEAVTEVESEAVETEAVEMEAAETETVETEAVEAETVETEAIETEAVETETVETEVIETETVETEQSETMPMETEREENIKSGSYIAGTYTASAAGISSDVTVTATFDENGITEITADVSGETAGIGADIGDEVIAQALAAQSAEIDGVSGATITSAAFKMALADCMEQAGFTGSAETEEVTEAAREVVVWSDPKMEELIRTGLNRPDGDIYADELAEVTGLRISGDEVTYFTGDEEEDNSSFEWYAERENQELGLEDLKWMSNIKKLAISGWTLSDLNPVSSLEYLMELELEWDDINDIGALSGLENLEKLYLNYNDISNISVLSGLGNLKALALDSNNINDISVLSDLDNLETLSMDSNNISDISVLSDLGKMKELSLGWTNISDISALSGLSNLTWLYLSGNAISDISVLSGLSNLETLYLDNNNISNIEPLINLMNLQTVSLIDNPVEDVSGLSWVEYLYID
jgi:uncharacterized protein with FMN-binding domain